MTSPLSCGIMVASNDMEASMYGDTIEFIEQRDAAAELEADAWLEDLSFQLTGTVEGVEIAIEIPERVTA